MTDGPLIVQSDRTLLLDVDHDRADQCRDAISPFAVLERAPEHIHTYSLSPLGLWNARAAGHDGDQVCSALTAYSRFPVPEAVLADVRETMGRYGRIVLESDVEHGLVLRAVDRIVLEEILRTPSIVAMLGARLGPDMVAVAAGERGRLKQALAKIGWPADDRAPYVTGQDHSIAMVERDGFVLRDYQKAAVDSFWSGGSGVVVLPCGSGKTLVGAAAMAQASAQTLILVTNTVAARQWRRELLSRTNLTSDDIGEYSGQRKEIRPVTIATYQVMVSRRQGQYPHLQVFDAQDWGLVIYDEVHLLPAPVFRMTADIQSRRRLGLTATLIREDGREEDVFTLIGPKRYDVPWREMESQGWIAPATCTEVRVTLTNDERMAYALAEPDERYRVGATARSKAAIVRELCKRHPGEQILVIGQYLEQIERLASVLHAPLITGKTTTHEREQLYQAFRSGDIRILVVSKVANFSIDLPEASVAIQVSGTFGSRQEEAQRLGRILRPKADGRQALFYSLVARDTNDQEFASRRQRFLAEQGYAYTIVDSEDVLTSAGTVAPNRDGGEMTGKVLPLFPEMVEEAAAAPDARR